MTAALGADSQTVIVLTAAAATIAIAITSSMQAATGYWLDQGVTCFNLVDCVIEMLQRQPASAKRDPQTCTLENVHPLGAPPH